MGTGFPVRPAVSCVPVAAGATSAGANPELWRFRDSKAGLSIGRVKLSEPAFFFFDQNLAFTGMVGLTDDAFIFHPLYQ